VLVGNFNNSSNNQGTGTTIVDLHANGTQSVFAQLSQRESGCTGGVGLTTALVQLKTGWVIVGSLPSTNGKISTAAAGCLLVLSPTGKVAEAITEPYLDGPWDATVRDNGNIATLFVSNTLIGITKTATGKVDEGDVGRLSLSQTSTSASRSPRPASRSASTTRTTRSARTRRATATCSTSRSRRTARACCSSTTAPTSCRSCTDGRG